MKAEKRKRETTENDADFKVKIVKQALLPKSDAEYMTRAAMVEKWPRIGDIGNIKVYI